MDAESGNIQKQNGRLNFLSLLFISLAVFAVFSAAAPNVVRALFSQGRSVRVTTEADHLLPPPPRNEDASPMRSNGDKKHSQRSIPSDSRGDKPHDYESNDPSVIPESLRNPFADREEPPGALHNNKQDEPLDENENGGAKGLGSSLKMGMVRGATKLLDGPFDTAAALGEVEAGAQVVVLKEENGFVLVVQSGKMGWAPKSEIVLR